ncbi:MAG: hypothetical protein HGJ94_20765 [Desulfosarcina sp.]|nr:hypothetical protein [Desulfosarcina sp.]MBC2741946.1 hypothetical protein [Desulfosarcina sp.]MBC2764859.1 hypothetical protein [Desulfosarcina sp.]
MNDIGDRRDVNGMNDPNERGQHRNRVRKVAIPWFQQRQVKRVSYEQIKETGRYQMDEKIDEMITPDAIFAEIIV